MDEKHPEGIDPRPKRRKDQSNPYKLFTVGIDTEEPHYYVSFPDSQGVQICMEISKVLFDTLDQFELNDLSALNEMDNHFEQSELTEESLSKRATVHIYKRSVKNDMMLQRQNSRPETRKSGKLRKQSKLSLESAIWTTLVTLMPWRMLINQNSC